MGIQIFIMMSSERGAQENHATPKTDSKYKFPALYAKFPVWSKVAVISRGSWALGAPGSRPAA